MDDQEAGAAGGKLDWTSAREGAALRRARDQRMELRLRIHEPGEHPPGRVVEARLERERIADHGRHSRELERDLDAVLLALDVVGVVDPLERGSHDPPDALRQPHLAGRKAAGGIARAKVDRADDLVSREDGRLYLVVQPMEPLDIEEERMLSHSSLDISARL